MKRNLIYILSLLGAVVSTLLYFVKDIPLKGSAFGEYYAFPFIMLVFGIMMGAIYKNFGGKEKGDPIFKVLVASLIVLNLINIGLIFIRY